MTTIQKDDGCIKKSLLELFHRSHISALNINKVKHSLLRGIKFKIGIPGLFGGTGALRFFPAELMEFVEPPRTFPVDKPFPLR